MNGQFMEYLKFNKMVTPVIIQVLFWLFTVVVVVGGLGSLSQGEAVGGIVMILLGPVIVRIYAELLLVIFKINDAVQSIASKTTGQATPSA